MELMDTQLVWVFFCAVFLHPVLFLRWGVVNGGICLILAGALIDFYCLIFNAKSKHFHGRCWQCSIGGNLCNIFDYYSMHSFEPTHSIIVPIIILSNFIFDATCTICIRFSKENILFPHRSHFYQKLNIIGWSHQQIIWLEYLYIY